TKDSKLSRNPPIREKRYRSTKEHRYKCSSRTRIVIFTAAVVLSLAAHLALYILNNNKSTIPCKNAILADTPNRSTHLNLVTPDPASFVSKTDSPNATNQIPTVVCLAETPPAHVKSRGCTNGYYVGRTCTYSCEAGFEGGFSKRTCTETGGWVGSFPSCGCARCHGGKNCQYKLTWDIMQRQVDRIRGDKEPVKILYGDHSITCESDFDILFINSECTCTDSHTETLFTCNNYLNRKVACRHALSHLLRELVSKGVYEKPCDLVSAYPAC
uniref:Sushi domain-containing protein n=1 Tax=Ciona savignyi TaxID=51511 RepID=H2YMF6_CIOSA